METRDGEQICGRAEGVHDRAGRRGTPVAEIGRKAGIGQATCFNWKRKCAGLLPTEMKRPKQLEDENTRLKKIVADLTLDREMVSL